jgi:hypothetical protein
MKPTKRSHLMICEHSGDCYSSKCACSQNHTSCRGSCKCPPACPRRLESCNCAKFCKGSCLCIRFGRECTRLCRCFDTCYNVFEGRATPKLEVKTSRLPEAGDGVFATHTIGPDRYLGTYDGELVMHNTIERGEGIYLFQISKGIVVYARRICKLD